MRFNLDLLDNLEFPPERRSQMLEEMKHIYPDASETELLEGRENLENYLRLALRISARLLREGRGKPLTVARKIPSMTERSSTD